MGGGHGGGVHGDVDECTPLLAASGGGGTGGSGVGKASTLKTYGNIFVSIVGSGVLGLPYTYKTSGYAVSTACVASAALLSWYCMMKLVKCRDEARKKGHHFTALYGDLGDIAFGNWGRQLVDVLILISQSGCCVAYLIFIGQNLSSIFLGNISQYKYFIIYLLPIQILMALIRSLAGLAPFSIIADVCNLLAMAVVVKDDIHDFKDFSKIKAFQGWSAIPFAMGVAVYCYEGFGMTLTLQSSMKKPKEFGRALAGTFAVITSLYLAFGFIGYVAYGEHTRDIITLNLPDDWTTVAIKTGLSIGLFFTFPVMLYPVHEIFERKLLMSKCFQRYCSHPVFEKILCNCLRGSVVLVIATVAATVPGFALFISLVGSTVCALIAFVIPAVLHTQICGETMGFASKLVDGTLIACGILFAGYGTYTACHEIFAGSRHSPGELPGS